MTNVPKNKDYDPVSGSDDDDPGVHGVGYPDEDPDDDEDDCEGDEEDDSIVLNDAYLRENRDMVREAVLSEHSTGRQWHEVCATLESVTFAMQVADRGCLVRTISWSPGGAYDDDEIYIDRSETTWLAGVTLEHLIAKPETDK